MPAVIVPIADNASFAAEHTFVGGATGAQCSDDGLVNDGDTSYFRRDAASAYGLGNQPSLKLAAITDPGTDYGFTVNAFARNETLGTTTLTFDLFQGDPEAAGVLLETKAFSVTSTAYGSVKTATFAGATIAAVTNFADLWLRVTETSTGSRFMRVTDIYVVVPDAPGTDDSDLLPMLGAQ